MNIPRGVDKKLVQEVMRLGGYRTQAEAVRVALLSDIERRLPKGQSMQSYFARLQARPNDEAKS